MSRQFRYRVTAIVLGGLLLGGSLLINGTASAGQTADAGHGASAVRRVTFAGGGMFGLSCRSHPDVEAMVVPARSRIRVVNKTGHDAVLELAGKRRGMLADDSWTEVVFRRGTTSVQVKPACAVGNDASPVLVTAGPSAPAGETMLDPIPIPTGPDSSDSATPSKSPDPTRPNTPPSAAHASRPATRAHHHRHPAVRPHASPTATSPPNPATPTHHNMPTHHKIKRKVLPRTPAATALAHPGTPSGERDGTAPNAAGADPAPFTGTEPASAGPPGAAATPGVLPAAGLAGGSSAAGLAGGSPADGPAGASPAAGPPGTGPAGIGPAGASPGAGMAAAEPVAAMEPLPDRGSIGLLALIASVCVLGVGIAAIRAIVSQRASRSNMS